LGYTETISRKPPLPADAPVCEPLAGARPRGRNGNHTLEQDPAMHKAGVAFFFLLVFTGLLFGRPSDIIWSLQAIPLAQIGALAAAAAYVFAVLQGGAPFILTREMKIVLALTVLFVLGLPFAYWRQMTYDTLTKDWVKTLVIFLLITQTMFTMDRVRKLMWTILVCMFFVCAHSLVVPNTSMVMEGGRMRGSTVGFLSGNYLGLAAAVTLPFIGVFLIRSRSFVKTMFLIGTFALVMLMVVKGASRSNMICVLISLALVWWKILYHTARGRVLGVVLVLAIVGAVLSAPAIFWERVGTLWSGEGIAVSDDARSAGESEFQRKALVRRAIQYTLENPLLGLGLGNFSQRSGGEYGAQDWKGTHNTYLQLAAEAGIPGFVLFLALLWTTVKNMRRINRSPGEDPAVAELRQMARATSVSIYAFMLAGFFAHLAYDFYLYYLIGISVALQAIHRHYTKRGLIPEPAGPRNGSLRRNHR
jgi:O-antigen ligase